MWECMGVEEYLRPRGSMSSRIVGSLADTESKQKVSRMSREPCDCSSAQGAIHMTDSGMTVLASSVLSGLH